MPASAVEGYDPFAGTLLGDPYPTSAYLREEAPAFFSEHHGFWALSRHEDVVAALRDWEVFSAAAGVDIDGTGDQYGAGDFLEEDPPLHDQLRNVVREFFVPKRIRAGFEDFIRDEIRRLLSPAETEGGVDLADALAWPLPVAVGTTLLGIPTSDRPHLLGLQRRFAARTPGSREVPDDALFAASELRGYFADLLRRRRSLPSADIVSAIATAEVSGRPLGDSGVGMLFLLFVASIETTASSIGNAVSLLASYPFQRSWLAENPAAIEPAVEEVLRFEAPVQVTKRVTTREVELHGIPVPARSEVFLVLAAANRDPRRYERADEFDVRRQHLRHVAFGEGIHHCLGAPLARLEVRLVIEHLLMASPEYEVLGPGERLPSHFVRGFSELPGRLT